MPELASIAQVHEVPFPRLPSHGLVDRDWLDLLRVLESDSSAARVAASAEARGQGGLVVLNDTIVSAREVTKTNTFRVHAVRATDVGPLGFADADGRVVFYHSPVRRSRPFVVSSPDALARVDVIVSARAAATHPAEEAALLLALALTQTRDEAEIQRIFAAY